MKFAVISHKDCEHHDIQSHPESPDRIRCIDKALREASFSDQLLFAEAPFASGALMNSVHSQEHVKYLVENAPQGKKPFKIDDDTQMGPSTFEAAARAAGAVVHAVDLVANKSAQSAFCNIRPPGHHAESNKAMGFCFFNNIAMGAQYALDIRGFERVVIIDFDVHHGNGTEEIVANKNNIQMFSSYQEGAYPNIPFNENNKNIHHLPIPMGCGAELLLNALKGDWREKILSFNPDLIMVSAGFDAHKNDPLAQLQFATEDYRHITDEIVDLANACCEGRVVSVLEGGYNLDALSKSVVAHIEGLISLPKKKHDDTICHLNDSSKPLTFHMQHHMAEPSDKIMTRSQTKKLNSLKCD